MGWDPEDCVYVLCFRKMERAEEWEKGEGVGLNRKKKNVEI